MLQVSAKVGRLGEVVDVLACLLYGCTVANVETARTELRLKGGGCKTPALESQLLGSLLLNGGKERLNSCLEQSLNSGI